MRYQADYQKAVVTAEETLELYSENLMPLRLELLIDQLSNEIKLIPYSRFMEMHHLSLADVVQMLDSDLGACVCKPDSGQYLILYNDSMSTDVCRFTIGHELGHIFLKHHEMAGSNILSRTPASAIAAAAPPLTQHSCPLSRRCLLNSAINSIRSCLR